MINDFTGYNIIIRDGETDQTIINSVVLSYNKEKMLATIDDEKSLDLTDKTLKVLIYNTDEAFSFMAHAPKHTGSSRLELGLFHGEHKEERKNERFPLGLDAVVIEHISAMGEESASRRLPSKIIDISKSGVCVECVLLEFKVGDRLAVQVMVQGKPHIYYCEIVRIIMSAEGRKQYGCTLLKRDEFRGFIKE